MKLSLLFTVVFFMCINLLGGSEHCADTIQIKTSIQSYCDSIQHSKSGLQKLELFKSTHEEGYQLVPYDSARYLGDARFDIIHYGDPVLYLYQGDTLKALSSNRVFVYVSTSDSMDIKLIEIFQHEDPEGAQYDSAYFYIEKGELIHYFHVQVDHDYWSKSPKHIRTEKRDYFCEQKTISSTETKFNLNPQPLEGVYTKELYQEKYPNRMQNIQWIIQSFELFIGDD